MTKKNKIEDDQILKALHEEMGVRLSRKISLCLDKKQSTHDLKNTCLSATRLERGLVTEAEKRADFKATTVEIFLKRQKGKKSFGFWTEFVKSNFDSILKKVGAERKGKEKDKVNEESSSSKIEVSVDVKIDIDKEEEMRAVTTSLDSIICSDLLDDIRTFFFLETIRSTIEAATNYTTDYSTVIRNFLLVLKDYTFDIDNDNVISLVKLKGENINTIILDNFNMLQNNTHLPPPISAKCCNSDYFNNHYKKLLDIKHLQIIQSSYFGERGTVQSTLDKNSLHKSSLRLYLANKTRYQY